MGFAVVAVAERVDERTVRLIASVETGIAGPGAFLPRRSRRACRGRRDSGSRRTEPGATDDLEARHINDHHALYDRACLVLEAGEDAGSRGRAWIGTWRYFNFGRYLLIASSRRGTQPANWQGIWNVDVRPLRAATRRTSTLR